MYNKYTTKKGTELPLMNLKGKPYMQVAHRLVWFTEEAGKFEIKTEFPKLTDDETVAHVVVTLFDDDGKMVKSASATKREDKKAFADHTEKAETGAIGRALALIGYGTQFAIADIDEGDRLADSPVATVNRTAVSSNIGTGSITLENGQTSGSLTATVPKKPTFNKNAVKKDGDLI